jgi:UDP-glucose 4-epimerase
VRALITGGAGFLGSTLVERLVAEGHEVDVVDDLSTGLLTNLAEARVDRTGMLHFHQADVRSHDVVGLIARRHPDVVFHLAGRPERSLGDDAELNVVGSLRVVDGAVAAGASKFVFASDAAAVYGPVGASTLPVRESEPPSPIEAFGASKNAVAEHLRALRSGAGLEFTVLLFSTVYGPRDVSGPVARIVDAVVEGRPVAVPAGSVDLVYVDDAVDALARAVDHGGGLIINIGSGVEMSATDLVALVAEQADLPIPTVTAVGRASRFALDRGRARIHLRWEPWTSVPDGLAEVLRVRRAEGGEGA